MSNQPPLVPPANRSDKGPARTERPPKETTKPSPSDPDKTGQQANTAINTTHQGHQQDR